MRTLEEIVRKSPPSRFTNVRYTINHVFNVASSYIQEYKFSLVKCEEG